MSSRNLQQSFEDRDRVPKIQGLLNELMTFLEDDLSAITGAYDEVLSLDEVIEKELILFVSLNTNKNSKAVTALGRMLLQNMQLIIGKRYEDEQERRRKNRPMVSVILDEFAPFRLLEFRADSPDSARHQHGISVRIAIPATASDGRPWLPRRRVIRPEHDDVAAHA